MINGGLHRRQEFSVPEQCRTEAATELTLEMGQRRGIVKVRRPPQAEVVLGSEAGMHVCVLERCNEGCNSWNIYTQPVQEIAQQCSCLSGVEPRRSGNEVRTDRLALGGRLQ